MAGRGLTRALALLIVLVVHGAWGYPILDLMGYTAGCLAALATVGLIVAARLRP